MPPPSLSTITQDTSDILIPKLIDFINVNDEILKKAHNDYEYARSLFEANAPRLEESQRERLEEEFDTVHVHLKVLKHQTWAEFQVEARYAERTLPNMLGSVMRKADEGQVGSDIETALKTLIASIEEVRRLLLWDPR